MLSKKLITSAVLTAAIVVAAVTGDYAFNVLILATPWHYSPLTTAVIALIVGAPITFSLVSQRYDLAATRDRLARLIAEKELAEAEREQTLERLKTSEARYRILAEHSSDVIIRYGQDSIIEYVSPSVRQFGYAPEDLIGKPMDVFTHPDHAERTAEIRSMVASGFDVSNAGSHEFPARTADGSWVWFEGSPSPLFDEAGRPIGAVTAVRNITQRRAMEAEIRRRQAEAEAASQAKSDFLANMTHELRTPLNAIVGFSGLLKGAPELSPLSARRAAVIADASEALLAVVNDILSFSKLEAGAIEPEAHPFDAVELAEAASALLSLQAEAKGVAIRVEAAGPRERLVGDPALIRQVILNLLSNAVKFTPAGEIVTRLSIRPDGAARRLRIEVEDTGIGVPPDQAEAIFDRFTQADASVSRTFGGTGLGLAISRRAVEAMGGEIGLQSAPGIGSTFWFELPLAPAAAGTPEEAPGPEAPGVARLRVLLVDDNAINRELVEALLSPFDIHIEQACDGVGAVAAAASRRFDLILMDVQMPNMDGLTATRRIRASGDHVTPVVAMTANVLPEQVQVCREAGMDDHIGKPIRPEVLLEVIARCAGPREAADQISISRPISTTARGGRRKRSNALTELR